MFKKSGDKQTATQSGVPGSPCVLGPTLKFKGALSADEDLIILATVEGTIAIPRRQLTLGEQAHVKADIRALRITVEGTVDGNLHSEEAVIITKTADVSGNIFAPRISIENGAKFNGRIEMRPKAAEKPATQPEEPAEEPSAAEQTLEVVAVSDSASR